MTERISGMMNSVYTDRELQEVEEVLDILFKDLEIKGPDWPKLDNNQSYAHGACIGYEHFLYDWLDKKIGDPIRKHFDIPFRIEVAMYLYQNNSWIMHSDYKNVGNFGQPLVSMIIPLDWDGAPDLSTHTVIFDQSWQGSMAAFCALNPPLENNCLHLKYSLCGHIPEHHLERVGLKMIFPWRRGDVGYWDIELLHCGGNFTGKKIKFRRALVLFCCKDQ